MILTQRFGALRARRNFTNLNETPDERELRTDAVQVTSERDSQRDTDTKAA